MKAEEKEESVNAPLENITNEAPQISAPLKRPKRNIMQKNLEYNNGLLWREEKDLKKALYASLQENKKNRVSESEGDGGSETHAANAVNGSKRRKKDARNGNLSDESSNSSPKRTKVHAQRKFAQGSNPNSPAPTPVKFRNNSSGALDLLPSKRPKTEDFLTFLCLRGTSILPPSLDFFGLATRSEISNDSRCQSPVNFDVIEKQKPYFKQTVKPTNNKNGKWTKSSKIGAKSKDKHADSESDLSNSDLDDEDPEYDGRRINSSPAPGHNKVVCSVQALKQKYKQQRLQKQQKALAQAKKMLDANMTPKKDKSRGSANTTATATTTTPSTPSENRDKKKSTEQKKNKKKTDTAVESTRHNKKKEVNASVTEKVPSTTKKNEPSRPVTRNSTMMTRSLKEELDRAAFEASKRASDSSSNKRETRQTTTTTKKASTNSTAKRNTKSSKKLNLEFSSEDDEPLSKKAKSSSGSRSVRSSTSIASDDSWSVGQEKRKLIPSKTPTEKRCLRSSGLVVQTQREEEENVDEDEEEEEEEEEVVEVKEVKEEIVPRTASGRPSRKTKEAATVYLELLGKRLMAPDLFDDEEEEEEEEDEKPKKSKSNKKGGGKNAKSSVDGSQKTRTRGRQSAKLDWKTNMKSSSDSDFSSSSSSSGSDSDSSSDYKYRINARKNKTVSDTKKKKAKEVVPKVVKKEVVDSETCKATKSVNDSKSNIKKIAKSNPITETFRYEIPVGLDDHCNYTKKPPQQLILCKQEDNAKNKNKKSQKESKYKRQIKEKFIPVKEEEDTVSSQEKFPSTSTNLKEKVISKSPSDSTESLPDLLHENKEIQDATFADLPDFDDGSVHVGESTSIAVKENITSNSVAIQVNLVDDISDFEDELINFTGSDFGSDDSLSLERILTPSYFSESLGGSSKGRLDSLFFPRNDGDSGKTKNTRSSDNSLTQNKCQSSPSSVSTPPKPKPKSPLVKQESSISNPSRSATPQGKRRGRPPGSSKAAKAESLLASQSKSSILEDETPVSLMEAPTFTPSEEEFQDPMEYIEKIRPEAEKFGICRIIPPAPFKIGDVDFSQLNRQSKANPECKVNDDMRFTAHNQYIHKMFNRTGPSMVQLAAIRRHLESQGGNLDHIPLIGGMELDLPKLYQTVENHGGIKEVIEKKKWQKVADAMKIPKSAQDRITKLYDAYCKYLLSYSMLTKDERHKLEHQLQLERQRKKNKANAELDECVTKGRSMSLSCFYRIARNTMAMWFKQDPQPEEVESDYWKLVTEKKHHVCVHAGNIDSSVYGYGFTCNKNSTFARHPWNLKVLTNNPGTVLRSMGPIMGVTIPTLHVGMLFTTGCWYRDPHCLPWIEYLHAGASKIWYAVPASQSQQFRNAMKQVVPEYSTNNPIWLPSDTAMVPPTILVKNGASLCRAIQDSGQFVLVFPRAFTSTICCGYTVSESVYFAHHEWLENAEAAFKEIRDSCEPAVFSLERLLFCITADNRSQPAVLQIIQPVMEQIRQNELSLRKVLFDLGLKTSERLPHADSKDAKRRRSRGADEEQEYECDVCRANCYVSMVVYPEEDIVYCLNHAIEHFQKKKRDLKYFKLLYTYDQAELNELVQKLTDKLGACTQKRTIRKSPKSKKPF